jgi:hypothetical protein
MNIKVGKWWDKFDKDQKESLLKAIQYDIAKYGSYTVNDHRKFLTSAKKQFGENIRSYNVIGASIIAKDNTMWYYNRDRDDFMQNIYYKG